VHRPQVLGQRAQGSGQLVVGHSVDAHVVVPPYSGSVTARSSEAFGIRSTNVTSVCQLLALSYWESMGSTRSPRDVTVGCAVVASRGVGERELSVVVEMVTAARGESWRQSTGGQLPQHRETGATCARIDGVHLGGDVPKRPFK